MNDARPPLEGLRVLELARILAGPWAGQILADLGATVVKVEAPEGDDTRRWGPPFIDRPRADGTVERVAAYFHAANRGKTSVVCDFNDAADLDRLVTALAARAGDHRDTVMAGRTHLQHALPVTFGFKCAAWLSPLLTAREREVLVMIAEGKTNKEIATALNLSIYTVESYRGSLMEKLNLHNTGDIVRFALRNGLIT